MVIIALCEHYTYSSDKNNFVNTNDGIVAKEKSHYYDLKEYFKYYIMMIGFSCGDFYRLQNDDMNRFSKETTERFYETGARAIELMCHTTRHLMHLSSGTFDHIKKFDHISIHAPAYAYDDSVGSHEILKQLADVSKIFSAAYVVFHPDAVERWDVISRYDMPIAIENMDDRKKSFRTYDDVKKLLDAYPFGLVIDLQHCYVNDPSMHLARELHTHLNDRLVGYHISGYDPKMLHVPLFETEQKLIIEAMERRDVPIIIESSFAAYDDAQKELNYMRQYNIL